LARDLAAIIGHVEASLDFADDDGAGELPPGFRQAAADLAAELEAWLSRPRTDRLRDGIRVVLAGPPNSGKSTLFNALLEEDAAITSPHAGTTRDALERHVAWEGVPSRSSIRRGLRDEGAGDIEAVGIARARGQMERPTSILWLGPEGCGRPVMGDRQQIDVLDHQPRQKQSYRVSGITGRAGGTQIGDGAAWSNLLAAAGSVSDQYASGEPDRSSTVRVGASNS
jgi:tRNA modification GTPase